MTDAAERLYERLLVLRCQTGDESAFAELVERYQPRLHYYLRTMLREAHRVDDVLQEVWCDVFRSVPRLVDVGAFPAWVYRIAHDRAQREFRRRRLPQVSLEEDVPADGTDNDAAFSADDAARVHAALEELAPEHREVLVLRFMDNLTYDDIAAVTGCPLGTVRSRLHYAKCALRRALERMNDD